MNWLVVFWKGELPERPTTGCRYVSKPQACFASSAVARRMIPGRLTLIVEYRTPNGQADRVESR
jgi:hypothetical protein